MALAIVGLSIQLLSLYILFIRTCNAWVLPGRHSLTDKKNLMMSMVTDGDSESVNDDSEALSQFGTRAYWDDVYLGRGDFPSEEYA